MGVKTLIHTLGLKRSAKYTADRPHITLYHGKWNHVPRALIEEHLHTRRGITGTQFQLHDGISLYGGKFVFWNLVLPNQPIQELHTELVQSYAQFFDRAQLSPAQDEGLTLDDEERANLEQYGHPLVLRRYLPHITLAYTDDIVPETRAPLYSTNGGIYALEFVRIGQYGAIKEVIASTNDF